MRHGCFNTRYLRVDDQLWRRFLTATVVAHFLDSRSESFDSFLLLRDQCSLFLNYSMLVSKTLEQHRVIAICCVTAAAP